jgi:hypothetical protein
MSSFRIARLLGPLGAAVIGLTLAGCSQGPDDAYGTSRGASLNGTSVFAAMLRSERHELRTAIRLSDELAEWADGIVRFAPYPGPPDREEAEWYEHWLADDADRWLIYVVRDFDAVAEYWKTVADRLPAANEPERRAEAEEHRSKGTHWVRRLPNKAKKAADPYAWFEVNTGWNPPRTCTNLTGEWAAGIDGVAAGLTVHEAIRSRSCRLLLEADGKPFVMEKTVGAGRVLVVANGSFLLNEGVANPARRPLAERVLDWVNGGSARVAMVDGPSVLGEGEGMPSLWDLLWRIPPLRWVAIQVGLAAFLAALARAPRLGRPRPDPPSGADRPAEHAVALGALLAKTGAAREANELVDSYRRWRTPHPRKPGLHP